MWLVEDHMRICNVHGVGFQFEKQWEKEHSDRLERLAILRTSHARIQLRKDSAATNYVRYQGLVLEGG